MLWGKLWGDVPWGHLWAMKTALFRTDCSDTLWASEYRCLSPRSVTVCNASLRAPGHHCFWVPTSCLFFFWLFFTQRWGYPCGWLYRSQLMEPSWILDPGLFLQGLGLQLTIHLFRLLKLMFCQHGYHRAAPLPCAWAHEGLQGATQKRLIWVAEKYQRRLCLPRGHPTYPFFEALLFLTVPAYPVSHMEWILLSFHKTSWQWWGFLKFTFPLWLEFLAMMI